MKKTHYSHDGVYTACGRLAYSGEYYDSRRGIPVTQKCGDVTCSSCKTTSAFNYARRQSARETHGETS